MNFEGKKCVMVIDEELPLGIITNTAAIMGITLGKMIPEYVGPDVKDQTGHGHLGIIALPVPILKSTADGIRKIRERLFEPEFEELTVVDFSDVAQSCNVYDEFIEKIGQVPEETLK